MKPLAIVILLICQSLFAQEASQESAPAAKADFTVTTSFEKRKTVIKDSNFNAKKVMQELRADTAKAVTASLNKECKEKHGGKAKNIKISAKNPGAECTVSDGPIASPVEIYCALQIDALCVISKKP